MTSRTPYTFVVVYNVPLVNPHGHTDTHTDGTDFIPSTADAGGNKIDEVDK